MSVPASPPIGTGAVDRRDAQLVAADSEFAPSIEHLRSKRTAKWHHVADDVLPAWIAETDFDLCPAVVEALERAIGRGDAGYPDWWDEPLADAFSARMAARHGWQPDPAHVRHTCDLVQAMQVVVELTTRPGEAVALHVPNYPPFLRALESMQRTPVFSPIMSTAAGWELDAQRLDDDVARSGAKVLLVVNPHNPTGRVFSRSELEALAEVSLRHDLVVVSDELHAELTHAEHRHVPFASLAEEVALRTVTITSATKSFNLGGMRTAVAHVGDARVRAAWDRLPTEMLGSLNLLGVEATLAAWRDGDEWLERQRRHLTEMRDHLAERLGDLDGVVLHPPEATFLAWLDCRRAAFGADPAAHFREHAKVELSPGPLFGPGGEGHVRLNFGTGRRILDEILDRMTASAVRSARAPTGR